MSYGDGPRFDSRTNGFPVRDFVVGRTGWRWLVALGAAEVALTTAAAMDLCFRPAAGVRGRKGLWWLGIFVQPVGPIAYLVWGRRP
ncbi:hypothetical protein FXF51_31925 [Nonomuraea sp. PA05]|uniref:PLDc N-terminal domain-containing protein n=1 Tax=Nonomuraea sp. PA05 TaxID=2604466 RepID=UPI0011D44EAB|nr:PLDc N-terminal domain-containing protein [Nonomuraea sp. PA05]TYB60207.1 hypothetical protein FXF51_31925 [Nonomuraea sp. PA05]